MGPVVQTPTSVEMEKTSMTYEGRCVGEGEDRTASAPWCRVFGDVFDVDVHLAFVDETQSHLGRRSVGWPRDTTAGCDARRRRAVLT